MRTTFVLRAALLALLLAAGPVAAHHGRRSHAGGRDSDDGPKGAKSEQRGGSQACDWQSDPGGCPGNSGWAHCCQQHGPGPAHGQCVAEHARAQGTGLDRDDDNENDDEDGQHGDLQIADVNVHDDRSFRIRGSGAEGVVTVSVGGASGQLVGSGQGEADQNGSFDIVGQWSCRDDDDAHEARVRARDADESDSERVALPSDEEE
jgi:hypothetical protein